MNFIHRRAVAVVAAIAWSVCAGASDTQPIDEPPAYSDKYRADGASIELTSKRVLRFEDGSPTSGVHVAAIWLGDMRTIGASWTYCAHLDYTMTDRNGRYGFQPWGGSAPTTVLLYAPGLEAVDGPFRQGIGWTSEPHRYYVIRAEDDVKVPPTQPVAGPFATIPEAVAASGTRNLYLRKEGATTKRLAGLGGMLSQLTCRERFGRSSPVVLPFIDAMTDEIQQLIDVAEAAPIPGPGKPNPKGTAELVRGLLRQARERAVSGAPSNP